MKILAIETSAKSVSAAVVEGGVPLASAYQNMGLTHSRTLMPLVDGMLSAAGLRVRDMDLLAAANGPGTPIWCPRCWPPGGSPPRRRPPLS